MLRYRSDLESVRPYSAGKSALDIDADVERIVKLASNECPLPPFPEVQQVIADAAGTVNRYPDTQARSVRAVLAEHLGVPTDHLWFGAGGSEIVTTVALSLGGPAASIVYPDPSFVLYRIATRRAMAEGIEIPLDSDLRIDLAAMAAALRDDTTMVYLCNPNNPTGTHLSAEAVRAFIKAVPESVLVFVDEAYGEFVTAPDYASAIPEATSRPNVVVMRTFSKVYGLAGLRIGYAVAQPEVITGLRRVQRPFTITDIAQRAAAEALRHPDRLTDRVESNAKERSRLHRALDDRDIDHTDSEANFIYFEPSGDPAALASSLQRRGVIPRQLGRGLRITLGTPEENQIFLDALDACRASMAD